MNPEHKYKINRLGLTTRVDQNGKLIKDFRDLMWEAKKINWPAKLANWKRQFIIRAKSVIIGSITKEKIKNKNSIIIKLQKTAGV
jgi:hypothetical protein